jgi:hypothetical protein
MVSRKPGGFSYGRTYQLDFHQWCFVWQNAKPPAFFFLKLATVRWSKKPPKKLGPPDMV